MKKNNKGFMLTELMVVSVAILENMKIDFTIIILIQSMHYFTQE